MNRVAKTTIVVVVLLALVGGASWGAWYSFAGPRDSIGFKTAEAEKGDLLATIRATGTVEPVEVVDVGAQVAGQVIKLGDDPSDAKKTIDWMSPVHPGTLLAQLDDKLYKARVDQMQFALGQADAQMLQAQANVQKATADLEQMKARFNQAKRDYDRAQAMYPIRAIADADYDAAVAGYETNKANLSVGQASIAQAKASQKMAEQAKKQAEANLREAEVNLGYTKITSPVEGIIVDRRVNQGQTVVASLNAPSLFLIAKDLKRIQIWASVNEADIGNIRDGQKVTFSVDAYPKDRFVGTVYQTRLNATMTNSVVTYTVVVDTDNSDLRLRPYMTANLEFEIGQVNDALLVPNAALRWRPKTELIVPDARAAYAKAKRSADKNSDDGIVWIADGQFVRPISIKIGVTDGVATAVTGADLQPGVQVVVGTTRNRASDDTTSSPFTPKMFGGKKQ
jgi:HlyD family secretion protein